MKAVEGAQRFMQFKMDRVLAAADLTGPEGRARAAEALVPVLREHPNELVREQYIQTAAGTLGIDHAWFKQAIARSPAVRRGGDEDDAEAEPEAAARRPRPVVVDPREEDVLRWAIHSPELVHDWLDATLFVDPVARAAFVQLSSSDELHDALATSEGDVRALLERLAVEEPQVDAEPETVRARLVVNLVEPAAERLLRQLAPRRRRSREPGEGSARSGAKSGCERMGFRRRGGDAVGTLDHSVDAHDDSPRTGPRSGTARRAAVATPSGASPDDIDALIARVKERGFVTTGEIFAALPDLEPETAELAAIYAEHGEQRRPGRRRDPRRARRAKTNGVTVAASRRPSTVTDAVDAAVERSRGPATRPGAAASPDARRTALDPGARPCAGHVRARSVRSGLGERAASTRCGCTSRRSGRSRSSPAAQEVSLAKRIEAGPRRGGPGGAGAGAQRRTAGEPARGRP